MTKFKLAMIAGAMVLAACGGNNETADNNGSNNTGTQGSTVADNNNNNNNNKKPNNSSETNTTGDTGGETNTPDPTGFPAPPNCDDTPQPARCTEDPANVVWGPASVIDTFWVAGTSEEPECCYDFGNSAEIDNALGMTLAGLDNTLDTVNDSIENSIATGSLVLLLEHNGITDLAASDPYEVNFYVGAHADDAAYAADGFNQDGGNAVLINPASFDDGAHPQAYLPEAEVAAGALSAGPGTVKVQVELFDTVVELAISLARTDADIRQAGSALDETGVALQNGQLGGVVRVDDVFDALNEFAATSCSCLGLPAGEDLIDGAASQCHPDANPASCSDTCQGLHGNCAVIANLGVFSDIDADNDGIADSISIGAFYTAVGASIEGVE